eukprot:2575637-Rhodomonas_salina.5
MLRLSLGGGVGAQHRADQQEAAMSSSLAAASARAAAAVSDLRQRLAAQVAPPSRPRVLLSCCLVLVV